MYKNTFRNTFYASAMGLLVATASAGAPVLAADSVYTKLNFDECITLESDSQGGVLSCSGYAGYGIILVEGDLRQSVSFGHVGAWFNAGGFESFSAFNRVNDTVEWVTTENGLPYATILRWFLENTNPSTGSVDPDQVGQVLVVSKVGQPGNSSGCVVGYVDALSNSDANKIARDLAAERGQSHQCGIDQPEWAGSRGALATAEARSFPKPEEIAQARNQAK